MPRKIKWPSDQRFAEILSTGEPYYKLSKKLGASKSSILAHARQLGIEKPDLRRISVDLDQLQLYFTENQTAKITDAAEHFNCSFSMISKLVRENGIIRKRVDPNPQIRKTLEEKFGPGELYVEAHKNFKITMKRRYGVEYAMHQKEALRKRQATIDAKRDPLILVHLAEGKKTCKHCGQLKLLTEFYKSKKDRTGRVSYCRDCYKSLYRVHDGHTDARRLKQRYGITREELTRLKDEQSNLCKLCKVELVDVVGSRSRNMPNVDHNHKTGKVRGILCFRCNAAIGLLDEDIDRLTLAIEYIKQDGMI